MTSLPALVPLAHGIGVRGDLPLPLWVVSYGAIGVLVISFVLLGRLWPEPRLAAAGPGVGLPEPLDRGLGLLEWPLRAVGLAAFVATLVATIAGPPVGSDNLAPFALYVALWVGGMLVSGLVGDLWRVLNPFETVAVVVAPLHEGNSPPSWLERAGLWPAAVGLLAFTWLELVHPDPTSPRVLAIAIAVYTGVLVLGALWWGPRWIRAADAFGAFFRVLAAMAPFHRDDGERDDGDDRGDRDDQDGRLRVRPPLRGLAKLEAEPGLAALVLVALGSTTFDGLTRTDFWTGLTEDLVGWGAVPLGTAGFLATISVVAAIYVWAVADAASHSDAHTTEDLVDRFVHSLVPIALGYAIAHYFSLLVFEGQTFLALLSDPLDAGWNLLGTADWMVDYTAVSVTTIAVVQVVAIVGGHVAGVVLAHDEAVDLFDRETAARSQYALLVAMVAYTVGALLLLLGA